MFRVTDPQRSLLESEFLIPAEKRSRLEKSWAHVFRSEVLSLIDEELYRDDFHPTIGRPNQSIRLLTGLHILKEWFDLTDEEVLEQLEFNLQWHYALGITATAAHLPRKTLHNHRVRTLASGRASAMFVRMTQRLMAMDGLSPSRQRLDSTHVISNMAKLTRLGLMVETTTMFLRELERLHPEKMAALGAVFRKRYLDREGYFSDVKKAQARRRLPVVADDLWNLVERFGDDEAVNCLKSYKLVARVFEEQCEVVKADPADEQDDGEPGDEQDKDEPADEPGDEQDKDEPGDEQDKDEPADEQDEGEPGDEQDKDEPADEQDEGEPGDEQDKDEPADDAPHATSTKIRLKAGKEIGSQSLQSPHDPDATYGHKGKGFEVQVAETCVESNPYNVITHIEVHGAHESDQPATSRIIDALREKGMSPDELLADTNYGSGENMVNAAVNGVDLQAPVQDPKAPEKRDAFIDPDVSGPTAGADANVDDADSHRIEAGDLEDTDAPMGLGDFRFDETFSEVQTCPSGQAPIAYEVEEDRREPYKATFDGATCRSCSMNSRCPTRQLAGSDDPILRWRDVKAATATRQRQQQGVQFKENYKSRSGIEPTIGELKGPHGANNIRVRSRARVDLVMQFKAIAVNAKRKCHHGMAVLRARTTALSPLPE